MRTTNRSVLAAAACAALSFSSRSTKVSGLSSATNLKRVTVFGGTGYVGSRVCERLADRGHTVTAISRRGINPKPDDETLRKVKWVSGDATDPDTVKQVVDDADAVVHAIGLLFDVESGLSSFNTIVSGSGSLPGESSTYDNVTRKTMFNVIDAITKKNSLPNLPNPKERFPLCFVSAAEAGWPDVLLGSTVEEKLAPKWSKKYLSAKRAVEARLTSSTDIRACIYRPSLIWDWTKVDVLPAIPIFNLACAMGVPFLDKTIRVETLADAVVQGVEDENVEGVQRYMQMEELAKRV